MGQFQGSKLPLKWNINGPDILYFEKNLKTMVVDYLQIGAYFGDPSDDPSDPLSPHSKQSIQNLKSF